MKPSKMRVAGCLAALVGVVGCTATGAGTAGPLPAPTPTAAPSALPAASPTPRPSAPASVAPTASPAASPTAGASPAGATIPGATFTNPTAITNRFAPWSALKLAVLEGEEDGEPARSELRKLAETKAFTINGATVQAVVIEDRAFEDGELVELTKDYFVQADDGTVYYLGEDVDDYEDGEVVGHGGAWLFGRDTMSAGVFMPAAPQVGDTFRPEDVPATAAPGLIREDAVVLAVGESVTVPAGTYAGCIRVELTTEDGGKEIKLYAPGVGVVRESEPGMLLELKAFEK